MAEKTAKTQNYEFSVIRTGGTGLAVPEVIDKKTSRPWVNWGEDNLLPNVLWDNYLKCSNLQAIINTMKDYTIGEGVETDWSLPSASGEYMDEIIPKCLLDYTLFGAFALEGLRNQLGEIVMLNYINVMDVRVNEELTIAYLSAKWKTYGGKDMRELPLYRKDEKQNHFVFYYRGDLTRNINPIPIYISALKSIQILNNTRNFHLRNLENDFTASAIISINNGELKKKELEEIKRKLEEQHCGSENAGKFLLVTNPDKEHSVTVERLAANNFGDLYQTLAESSTDDLYVAFRINKMLVGVNVQTGFSKEEYHEAFELYYKTVILPIQNIFTKQFSKLGVNIKFNKFNINWE